MGPEWKPLSELTPDIKPKKFRTPDGVETTIFHWADLVHATAAWLAKEKLISIEDCPVTAGRAKHPIIVLQPPDKADRKKGDTYRELPGGMHVYLKYNSQEIRFKCHALIEQFGANPDDFHFRA